MSVVEVNDALRRICRRYGRTFAIINSVLAVIGLVSVIVWGHVVGGAVVTSVGVLLAWRSRSLSVGIRADRLVMRSWLRTSAIELGRIRRFGVGSDFYLGASPSGLFDTLYYVRGDGRRPTVPAVVCPRLGLRGSHGMYPMVFELNHLLETGVAAARTD